MHAIVLGASGLTGSALCQSLEQNDYISSFTMLVRKEFGHDFKKGVCAVLDFGQLDRFSDVFKGDLLFCCLGTTISKAGSQAAFEEIDFHLPLHCAKLAKQAGVKKLILVSSIGADENSSNFYLRTKGKLERTLEAISFEELLIFRPGLLLGPRKETRVAESIFRLIMPYINWLLLGPLSNYKGIHVEQLAQAMVAASLSKNGSQKIFKYKDMI